MKFNKNKILESRLAQDSFWALFGNVVAKGSSLLGFIFVARLLGRDLFGEFGTVKTTLLNFAILSTFGLGYTSTKFVAEYRKSYSEKLGALVNLILKITLISSSIIALVLFSFSSDISESLLGGEISPMYLKILSIWIILNALTTTQIGILSGFGAFKEMSKINMYVGIFTFISTVLLTYLYSLEGTYAALILSQLFNWLLNYRELKKHIVGSYQIIESHMAKRLLNFSFPIALQEGLYALTTWYTIILLLKEGGYGQVGIYSAAMQWAVLILFVPGVLKNVILSHLSINIKNPTSHNRILNITLLLNLFSTLLPVVLIIVLLPLITNIYGDTFTGLRPVIILLCISSIFKSLSEVYTQAFMSLNKNWLMFWVKLFRDISIIILFIYLNHQVTDAALNLSKSVMFINGIALTTIVFVYRKIKI